MKKVDKLNRYQKILLQEPIYLQIIDRYKEFHKETEADKDIYVNVLAPTLVEFIRWVFACAKRDGIKRLYFLARDGYQMYLAAKYLSKKGNIDIECRYLNVSRYAIRVPEYHIIGEKCLDRICVGGIDVTFEKVMRRAGLNEDEALCMAQQFGYSDSYKDVMSYSQVIGLKDVLIHNKDFMNLIYRHSQEAYGNAVGYLKQEGLLDDISYAVVDSGWIGTMQQTLGNLLTTVSSKNVLTGYYFGLYETPKNSKDIYRAYFFEKNSGIKRKVNFSNCLFEAIFTSTEGMTLGYQKNGDIYVPIYDNIENPNTPQISSNIDTLKEYLDIYGNIVDDTFVIDDKRTEINREMVAKLLKSFMGHPSVEEVKAYGDNVFSDDVLEGKLQKVAAELTEEDIKNQRFVSKTLIMLGIKKKIIHESAWIEGSIVRNGKHVKENLRHARMYKYFVYIRKRFK